MVLLEDLPHPWATSAVGKLGEPGGLGNFYLGWSQLGNPYFHQGYYKTDGTNRTGKTILTRHWWPKNPQTDKQQANRFTFADGVQAWHNLTDEEKQYWEELKSPPKRNGFMRFMSNYLKENL